jgi:hypothetical protein
MVGAQEKIELACIGGHPIAKVGRDMPFVPDHAEPLGVIRGQDGWADLNRPL